jgi:hypothetical protein
MDPRAECTMMTMYHAVKTIARGTRIQFISPLLIVGWKSLRPGWCTRYNLRSTVAGNPTAPMLLQNAAALLETNPDMGADR